VDTPDPFHVSKFAHPGVGIETPERQLTRQRKP
jgi:hypothetical protein